MEDKTHFQNLYRNLEASKSITSPLGLAEVRDIHSVQLGVLCIVKVFQTSSCFPSKKKKETEFIFHKMVKSTS